MILWTFTLQHFRRHWRLNLAVLLGLVFATALLASLPGYATAIAARGLEHNIQTASPATRNLLVNGPTQALSSGLYGRIQESLGELVRGRLQVRQVELPADPLPPTQQVDGGGRVIRTATVSSIDKLNSSVAIIQGRLPRPVDPRDATNPLKPPPLEAVIGAAAAQDTGLGVGTIVSTANGLYRLDIVGIVEPLDPRDDQWLGDVGLFDTKVDTSNANIDFIAVPLLVSPTSLTDLFPRHALSWRLTVNHDQITVDSAQAILSNLTNIQAILGPTRASITTGLIKITENYITQLSRVRMSLFLLTIQAFIFVLYTLTLLASFLIDRYQEELAVLASRGATALQMMGIFALQSLILTLPAALLLGPLLAKQGLATWATFSDAAVPAALPVESRLLALLAGGFGWLALVIPVYPAARRSLLEWQQTRARPDKRSLSQKLRLDLFVLTLGALLFWQLGQTGSFVMSRLRNTSLADPLLLLGPSVLLIAVALLFLRLAPFLLRAISWSLQRMRGLMLPMSLARLARDPLRPSRVVLLISLTASLILFSNAFGASLARSQEEMAHYRAGADLRIALGSLTQGAYQTADRELKDLAEMSGVSIVSPVLRAIVQTEEGRGIQLIALDPASFEKVARYPTGYTNLTISMLCAIFQTQAPEDPLPAVFSYAGLPSGKRIGDATQLTLAGRRIPFAVRGTVTNFPTVSGAYVITSLPSLAARTDLASFGARVFASREAWLSLEPDRQTALSEELGDRLLDNAHSQLANLQADALAQGISGAFQLNTWTMALLSVAGFLLIHFFAAQRRVVEFSLLRAMGLSARQLLSLLAAEGALVMILGLAAGTLIGHGLAQLMIPYLSRALSESLGGVTISRILIDWATVVRLYLLLIAAYCLAMVAVLLDLMRVGIHRALRIGEE